MFGEDPARMQPDAFFGTFSDFLDAFAAARKDNIAMRKKKMEEEKRKKAEEVSVLYDQTCIAASWRTYSMNEVLEFKKKCYFGEDVLCPCPILPKLYVLSCSSPPQDLFHTAMTRTYPIKRCCNVNWFITLIIPPFYLFDLRYIISSLLL